MSNKRVREDTEPEQLSSAELLKIVQDISGSKGSQKEKQREFRKKYPTFAEEYPVLFDMTTRADFDMKRFMYMMNLRDSVGNNTISQYDASAKVGKDLYDVYVKPKIDGIPPTK